MTRLSWELRRAFESLGWYGKSGLFMLLAAVVLGVAVLPARMDELEKITAEVDALNARLRLTGPGSGKRADSHEEKLGTFYKFFPSADSLPDWLERIYAAAEKNGVRVDAGEYKLLQERGWKLDKYQITLPVKGSYPQIRGFISQVLADIPAIALDEVDFRRDGVGNAVLDVRLRLTLFTGRQ